MTDGALVFTQKGPDGIKTAIDVTSSPTMVSKDRKVAELKVVVVTGDAADAAFDGTVFITLYGADGNSEEIKLTGGVAALFACSPLPCSAPC